MTPEQLTILNDLRDYVGANAQDKGFHDQMVEGLTEEQIKGPIGQRIAAAVFTANLHGETSEFWEAYRKGTLNEPCDKAGKMEDMGLPGLTCAEEEIADVLIRTLDTAHYYGVDAAKAVATKAAFNRGRKQLHGGKLA